MLIITSKFSLNHPLTREFVLKDWQYQFDMIYRKLGILPQALNNFITQNGGGFKYDSSIAQNRSMDELIEAVSQKKSQYIEVFEKKITILEILFSVWFDQSAQLPQPTTAYWFIWV